MNSPQVSCRFAHCLYCAQERWCIMCPVCSAGYCEECVAPPNMYPMNELVRCKHCAVVFLGYSEVDAFGCGHFVQSALCCIDYLDDFIQRVDMDDNEDCYLCKTQQQCANCPQCLTPYCSPCLDKMNLLTCEDEKPVICKECSYTFLVLPAYDEAHREGRVYAVPFQLYSPPTDLYS